MIDEPSHSVRKVDPADSDPADSNDSDVSRSWGAREATASPVCSYNEWDPLEEVIVGVADGACVPPWHPAVEATLDPCKQTWFRTRAGQPFPEEVVSAARHELDGFIVLLEDLGITVRRPRAQDQLRPYATPSWRSTGLYDAMPRDVLLVVGEEIIECPLAWRSRHYGTSGFRPLLREYFRGGARWSSAPKPELCDELYDREAIGDDVEASDRYVTTELEPTFDAADFIRCGRDIFTQRSHVTNRFGIEWLRCHLGPDYRIHILEFDDEHPMHIDATFMPIAPGKLIINPERVVEVPSMFRDWEVAPAPDPVIPLSHPLYMTSRWVNMNIFMLGPQLAVVEAEEHPMADLLTSWGIEVIRCPFRHFNSIGGSFHCATLDVRRRGELLSYF